MPYTIKHVRIPLALTAAMCKDLPIGPEACFDSGIGELVRSVIHIDVGKSPGGWM